MKIQDILNLLEKVAPSACAEDWDNVGLLCGRRNAAVNRVLLCVDVTTDVINEAIEEECQAIIAHHPFLFDKISLIDDSDVKGRHILTLAEHKIAVIAAHTNADSVAGGMNDYLASLLGLKDVTTSEGSKYLRVGILPNSLNMSSLSKYVKEILSLKNAFMLGEPSATVSRVGVYTGASFVKELIDLKDLYDVVVTGEVKYHNALELKDEGIKAILCGHFGSELLFTWWFSDIIKSELPEIEVLIAKNQGEPLQVC